MTTRRRTEQHGFPSPFEHDAQITRRKDEDLRHLEGQIAEVGEECSRTLRPVSPGLFGDTAEPSHDGKVEGARPRP